MSDLRESLSSLARIKVVIMPVGGPSFGEKKEDASPSTATRRPRSRSRSASSSSRRASSSIVGREESDRYNYHFSECVRKLRSYRHSSIRLNDVTPPSDWRGETSAFPNIAWQDGIVSLSLVGGVARCPSGAGKHPLLSS